MIDAPDALNDQEAAIALLQEWMEAERIDYYRIQTTGRNDPTGKTRLIFYDALEQKGKYRDQDNKVYELGAMTLPDREWNLPLTQLQMLATQLGQRDAL